MVKVHLFGAILLCMLVVCAKAQINVNEQAKTLYTKGEFARTITFTDSIFPLLAANQEKFDIAIIASAAYGQLGLYDKSYEYSDIAHREAIVSGNKNYIVMALINKSGNYFFLKNYEKGLHLMRKALTIYEQEERPDKLIDVYNAISSFYENMGKNDSALMMVNEQKKLAKENPDARYAKILASYCSVQNDTASCNSEIAHFYSNYAKINLIKIEELSLKKTLLGYYIKINNAFKAAKYHDSLSLMVTKELGNYHLQGFYHLEYQYFLLRNDSINAFRALIKSNKYKERLDSTNWQNDINKTEQIIKLEKIRHDAQQLEMSLETSKKRLFVTVSGLGLFVILLLVIAVLYIKKHKQSLELFSIAQDREKMISILSHDVRAPLGQIIAIMKMVLNGDIAHDEQNQIIAKLYNNSLQTLKMLESMVNWMLLKNDNANLLKTAVSLDKVVGAVENDLQGLLDAKEIAVKRCLDIDKIVTNEHYLQSILQNLLSNAIKFSNNGSEIVIFSKMVEGRKAIGVQDFGRGITVEQLQKLRDGVSFSAKGTQQEKGLGLGMEIVRSSCCKINAQLKIESTLNKGAVFSVLFNE